MDNDIWPKRAWSSTWHLLDHATECGKGEAVARGNSIQRKVEMTLRLFTQPWRAGKHVWERALRVWPSDCVRLRGRGDLLLDTMRTMGVVSRRGASVVTALHHHRTLLPMYQSKPGHFPSLASCGPRYGSTRHCLSNTHVGVNSCGAVLRMLGEGVNK